jgi:hypothetical protein
MACMAMKGPFVHWLLSKNIISSELHMSVHVKIKAKETYGITFNFNFPKDLSPRAAHVPNILMI